MDLINLVDLNEVERQTYESLYEAYKSQQLEVSHIKNAITKMKNSVAYDMAKTSVEEREKIIKLQARIENLIALETLFEAPEIAEKAYKQAISNLQKAKERNQL